MDVGRLRVLLGLSGADEVKRGLRDVGQALDDSGQKVRQAGMTWRGFFTEVATEVAANFGTQAINKIYEFGKGIFMGAANMERYRTALTTAVGDAEEAQRIFDWVKDFATATPYQFEELIRSTQLLEIMGNDATKYLQTIGNAAAGANKTLDQATQAFIDAQTGEFERLKEFGVKAITENGQTYLSYLKNGEEVRVAVDRNNREMVSSTLNAIWNDMYAGQMEKMSKTFLGQWSTLKDNVVLRAQDMMGGVLDAARGGLSFVNEWFGIFDELRKLGLSPLEAGFDALHSQVNTTFGPETATKINDVIDTLEQGTRFAGVALSGATKGLASYGGYLLDVVKGGRVWNEQIKALPAPLGAVVAFTGRFAQSIGDLGEAFQRDGLAGVLRNLPREVGQIAREFGNMATEIGGAIFGALQDVDWGGAWEEAKSLLKTSIQSGIKLGAVLVDLSLDLASWALEGAKDLGGWLKGKLFGKPAGDGTGGPDPIGSINPLDVGKVLIDGIPTLGGKLLDFAKDVAGWVTSTTVGGGAVPHDGTGGPNPGRIKVSLGDVLVDVKEFFLDAPEMVTALPTKIEEYLNEQGIQVSWSDWKLVVGTPDEGDVDFQVDFAKIAQWAWDGLVDLATFGEPTQEQVNAAGQKLGYGLLKGIALFLDAAADFVFGEDEGGGGGGLGSFGPGTGQLNSVPGQAKVMASDILDAFFVGIGEGFWQAADEVVTEWEREADSWGRNLRDRLNAKLDDVYQWLFGGEEATPGAGMRHVDGLFENVWEGMQIAFDELTDLPDPELPGWLTDFGWLTGPVDDLLDEIKGAADDLKGAWDSLLFWRDKPEPVDQPQFRDVTIPSAPSSSPGTTQSGELVTTLPNVGAGPQMEYTASFKADTKGVAEGFLDVTDWGMTWDRAEYEATFQIDNGPAALAYTEAFRWGATWAAQNFTATFSIDTSPLDSALIKAFNAAQAISDLMPHSPARKGPLARRISFDYIAEALDGAMTRMAPAAARGAAEVNRHMAGIRAGAVAGVGGGAGRGGDGGNVNVIVQGNIMGRDADEYLEDRLGKVARRQAGKVVDGANRSGGSY